MAKKRKSAKKPKERSPAYPLIGLQEAIEKTKTLHEREGKNYVDKLTAVQHWGYKSLHGKALQILSSLYQYGLIERKRGEIKLSEDAFAIICAPENSQEKQKAIQKCATAPTVFANIAAKYPTRLPSDENLKWWLQKNNFSDNAASIIIESIKETFIFAKLSEKEYNKGNEQIDIEQDMQESPMDANLENAVNMGLKPIRWTFPFGEKTASLSIDGGKPKQEEMQSLINILMAVKETLPKKKEEEK